MAARYVPEAEQAFERLGWRMLTDIDRVYVNDAARRDLGWAPRHDVSSVLHRVSSGGELSSELARVVGIKGYHEQVFEDGPYPVER